MAEICALKFTFFKQHQSMSMLLSTQGTKRHEKGPKDDVSIGVT